MRITLTRYLASICGLTLAISGLAVPMAVAAPPSNDDIDQSRQAERSTESQIAELEIALAELSSTTENTGIDAQIATEEYLLADDGRLAAEARATEAAKVAAAARAAVEEARGELGVKARDLYRKGSVPVSGAAPYVAETTFQELATLKHLTRTLTSRTSDVLQSFLGVEAVADMLEAQASQARDEARAAADLAEQRRLEASAALDRANSQEREYTQRRDELIAQLAQQRQTTIELERERQDQLDEQRRERESQVAYARIQEQTREDQLNAASRDAGTRPVPRVTTAPRPEVTYTPAPVPSTAPAPTTPAPAPTTAAPTTPAPAPTTAAPTPAPRPTTPAPRPTTPAPRPTTAAPTPAPTTPAPRPTTPAPAPTTPAPKPTPKPTPPPPPPPPASSKAQQALEVAKRYIGVPYVWGGATPSGFDCSGLVMYSFAQVGVNLPRTSGGQYNATARVPVKQLQPGDLIFYAQGGNPNNRIYHVAFYAGNGMRVHAPSPGKRVELVKMYWTNVLPYGGRVK